jgi:hypothetical protein
MSFALTSPISIPLIVIVAGWATCLFLGYGLMSGVNAMSFVAVAVQFSMLIDDIHRARGAHAVHALRAGSQGKPFA